MNRATAIHPPLVSRYFLWVLLCSSILLSACSSVPLGTAWKYRNTSFEDLLNLDAEKIRIKVHSSEDLIIKSTDLGLSIEYSTTKNEYTIPLEKIIQKKIVDKTWWFEKTLEYSEWRVSDEGIADFKRLQEDWKKTYSQWYGPNSKPFPHESFKRSLSASTAFEPDSVFKDGYFSLWLKLQDNYELFIDNSSTNTIHQDLIEERNKNSAPSPNPNPNPNPNKDA